MITGAPLGDATTDPQLTWNLLGDLHHLFDYRFMVNAFQAGTIVALLAGLVGWFMVLRRQSFAGHTLAVVGFPGAAGAVLIGISPSFGYFGFAIVAALLIAVVGSRVDGRSLQEESAVTGTIGALALAFGLLFVSLYGGFLGGTSALLFGSFLGITEHQVLALAIVAVVALAGLALIARPLLFSSVDPDIAAARSVPVQALSVAFLILLAVTTAEVSQITGTLLVFSLLVAPAATAQRMSSRPAVSAPLTVAVAITIIWSALAAAYYSTYPIGFFVSTFAFVLFVLSTIYRTISDRYQRTATR